MSEQRHLISVLVENSPGELARIVGLFSGRGFNIDSLAVNTTLDPDKSRVVLTTRGDNRVVEQITKQLNKLVRVHKVLHVQGTGHVERELVLATINIRGALGREEAERLFRMCGARILSFSAQAFTVEMTGTEAEVDQFLELARPFGIRNMVRSAPITISKPAESELQAAEGAA